MTHGPHDEHAALNGHAPAHVRLELLSQPRYLCGAREMVASLARRLGFSDLACSQIALAVDEALANVMRHGYEGRADGRIWVSIWPIDKAPADEGAGGENGACCTGSPIGLRVVIEDEARQVDPEKIKGRDLEEIRPGGLGVHIIKHVMDTCCYEKRAGKGMRLTLEKKM